MSGEAPVGDLTPRLYQVRDAYLAAIANGTLANPAAASSTTPANEFRNIAPSTAETRGGAGRRAPGRGPGRSAVHRGAGRGVATPDGAPDTSTGGARSSIGMTDASATGKMADDRPAQRAGASDPAPPEWPSGQHGGTRRPQVTDPELEPWQEPVRGSAADLAALQLPGVEQVRAAAEGRVATAPILRLTGARYREVECGWVRVAMPASAWLTGPRGTLHPGALAVLADLALTGTAISSLPPGVLLTTAELSLTLLGPLPEPGGELAAEGHLVHADNRHGFAVCEIRGPTGTLLAYASARTFSLPPLDVSGFGSLAPLPPEPTWPTPDPSARPLDLGDVVDPLGTTGATVLGQAATGARPRPPVDRLFGIAARALERGDGPSPEVTFTMPASGWLGNEFGTANGGALALLATSATSAAGQVAARPGSPYRALDVKVNLLEAVALDGRELVAVGRARHVSKLTVASAEVRHGDALVALATGTIVLGS